MVVFNAFYLSNSNPHSMHAEFSNSWGIYNKVCLKDLIGAFEIFLNWNILKVYNHDNTRHLKFTFNKMNERIHDTAC